MVFDLHGKFPYICVRGGNVDYPNGKILSGKSKPTEKSMVL